jgi:hypothetical protein
MDILLVRSPAIQIMNKNMSHEELKANVLPLVSPTSPNSPTENKEQSDPDQKKIWLLKLDQLIHDYTMKDKDRFWMDLEGIDFEGTIKDAILHHDKIAACELRGKIIVITLYNGGTSFVNEDPLEYPAEQVVTPRHNAGHTPRPLGKIEEGDENEGE